MRNKKKQPRKLTFLQYILLFFVNILFYYSVVCIAMVILIILLVAFTRNAAPLRGASFTDMLPIILGVVIFIPIRTFQKRLEE